MQTHVKDIFYLQKSNFTHGKTYWKLWVLSNFKNHDLKTSL